MWVSPCRLARAASRSHSPGRRGSDGDPRPVRAAAREIPHPTRACLPRPPTSRSPPTAGARCRAGPPRRGPADSPRPAGLPCLRRCSPAAAAAGGALDQCASGGPEVGHHSGASSGPLLQCAMAASIASCAPTASGRSICAASASMICSTASMLGRIEAFTCDWSFSAVGLSEFATSSRARAVHRPLRA